MAEPIADSSGSGWRYKKRLLGGAFGAAVIGGVFIFVLPRIADYRDVWAVLKTLDWKDLLALTVATVRSVLRQSGGVESSAPRALRTSALYVRVVPTALSVSVTALMTTEAGALVTVTSRESRRSG